MLSNASSEDINKVCIVLWGIWVWRNKKVWEAKITTAAIAMDHSFNHVAEWRVARSKNKEGPHLNLQQSTTYAHKWRPPADGVLKVNVDASYRSGSGTFSLGMVLRNHNGEFMAGRNMCMTSAATVFEAEAIGTKEALSWIKTKQLHCHRVELETDSMLVVNGIKNKSGNLLEVGEVIDQCKMLLGELVHTSIHFVRNQANRVAPELARLPCLVNCHNEFMSLPSCLVEAVLRDYSF